MKFTKSVHPSLGTVYIGKGSIVSYYYSAKGRTLPVTVRIDGRKGPYRVDIFDGLGPWTAIDGGEGFRTLKAAKAYAKAWHAAAVAECTLTPRLPWREAA